MSGALPREEQVVSTLPAQEQFASAYASRWLLAWHRFRKQKRGIVGLATLALLVVGVILVPMISPFGVETPDELQAFAAPGAVGKQGHVHWLGTDVSTRDELTRLAYGGRLSLAVAILSTAALVTVGVIVGAV